MSALTKIFVVLLVLLSIVQTAGMVVWVNRQQNFNGALRNANTQLAASKAREASASADRDLAQSAREQLRTQMLAQVNQKQSDIDQLHATVTDRDTQLAQLNSNLQQLTAANKSANDALQVAQKTLDTGNTQMADLRKAQLDLQNRYSEATLAIDQWTNKYEVANRQWRDALEQVAQLQADNQKKDQLIKQHGISAANPRNINAEPLIRVEGIVQSKSTVGGIPVATISIGSADQVAKGMQFKVIDPKATDPFLGYLIVDRVEPNQALGHLTGPRVNEVRPGVEVRTQL